ncbi:MAG: hypothetical protein OCD02_06335 [Spirochaetaceae bacterium]
MTQVTKNEVERSCEFTEELWNEIAQSICLMNDFDSETKTKVLKHKVLKTIAATPYLAGCNNPLRTAMSHVAIYFLAASKAGKQTFVHTADDDNNYLLRLERISHFDGGNKQVIQKAMDLLALVMIEDYSRDMDEDRLNNKYNPFISGTWHYLKIKNELIGRISKNISSELDEILDIHEAHNTYWDIL